MGKTLRTTMILMNLPEKNRSRRRSTSATILASMTLTLKRKMKKMLERLVEMTTLEGMTVLISSSFENSSTS